MKGSEVHGNQKKKTRVRNRPRNKCNRHEGLTENEEHQVEETMPAEPTKPPQSSPSSEPDQGAIHLIQKLLRKKLLSKNKSSPPPVAPSAPAAVVPRLQVPQLPPPKATSDDQHEQVNDLLKCLGTKLQKGTGGDMPSKALLSKLQEMFSMEPLSDTGSSDDEAEYVEYIYKPRQYFMASLCNHCKVDLCGQQWLQCKGCALVNYCSQAHMREDQEHRQLCYGLRQLSDQNGHEVFYKSGDFNAEQFRSFRIVCIRQLEQLINRKLTPTEQEVLLFPYICNNPKCREHRYKRLESCGRCGEVAFCRNKQDHLSSSHADWCGAYRLFKEFVMRQTKYGRLEPPLPDKVLAEVPLSCCNTKQMVKKLKMDIQDECEFAALTQISTGPLTAFLALKLCDRLSSEQLTIHLIGAEMEFEVDVFQKWEIFLLHILPALKTLNVVFVGPELNSQTISFEQLSKIKCCRMCRKMDRNVHYYFENRLYHDYCAMESFLKPDLVCFFNSGLYRATGYGLEDTWPETIRATLNLKCPVVVTSYTNYEAPLDMSHFLNQSNRRLNVVLPPTNNPFGSEKPERNFISDDDAPFMFKNYQCFVVE